MKHYKKKLVLSEKQKNFLNQNWIGTEYCPNCNLETDFAYNPMKHSHIVCSHCGEIIKPCSLCDMDNCGIKYTSCSEVIQASLLHYNKKWNNEINGYY